MKTLTDAELLNILMNDPFHVEWAKQEALPKKRARAKATERPRRAKKAASR